MLQVTCLCLQPANQRWSGLVHQPTGAQPLVDRGDHRGPSAALHHPHFHGPADHSRHHQQEGAQTQSKALSWLALLSLCRHWLVLWSIQKGCGYHLDLFMVGLMLGVCSLMGLPWFVAATVLSITHVNSLKLESECSAPGEQPKFLGIREQRITGLMIFTLMGSSVFMTSMLQVRLMGFPDDH